MINLKGSISYLVADNLASNSIGGFIESFNTSGYCRFCLLTKEKIQETFDEDISQMRTKESYLNDCNNQKDTNHKKIHSNGVKNDSCLNELQFFNVTNGLPPDLMHDFLEGVIPNNLLLLLNSLNESKILSIHEFLEQFKQFNYGRIDSKNKVPIDMFNEKILKKDTISLSASNMWTLIRVFPIIFGFKLKENLKYLHFLKLIEIFRKINSSYFTEDEILTLKYEIFFYLSEYKIHYSEKNFKPKHHFITHYPNAIKRFGPPKDYSTMRFESKHSYFKRVNHATRNHLNLTKSLSYGHQNLQLFHLLSENYFQNELTFGPEHKLNNDLKEYVNLHFMTDSVTYHNWLFNNNINYNVNDIVVTGKYNNLPVFALIKSIINKNDEPILMISELSTLEYCNFLTGYIINEYDIF
ncbi:unnamed protein product [Brachionus calyciflorus]|uniref:Uncharacterized protein n=1 Tax=Brachionus calyciflorus TaxID=104777 RepID=A0A813UDM5_9BILA|nr:unnamed protein product [Brachionus calyciflorus]